MQPCCGRSTGISVMAYQDLGNYYIKTWAMHVAWDCWVVARILAPGHTYVQTYEANEQRPRDMRPQFGGSRCAIGLGVDAKAVVALYNGRLAHHAPSAERRAPSAERIVRTRMPRHPR
ncbi:hypothetical protein [Paraliomyxa miuraensis]|uniref:hypothetical protein n=1 Tax=Paraliomyxa miuraensis TaxID=376150 RepID=UPI00225B42F4|nr:hypothetical protein [Paraliomyxa miuraensis]MCX4243616.1 hypothetical protein [Paraliomyxa miuraensis]